MSGVKIIVVSPSGLNPLKPKNIRESPKGLTTFMMSGVKIIVVSPLGLNLLKLINIGESPEGLTTFMMYEYRKLTPEQRKELVKQRLAKGFPPHSPPHPIQIEAFYLLTVACYEHQPYISTPHRRQELLNLIFEQFINAGFDIRAWIILPNHYHLLVYVDKFPELSRLFNIIHGRTSRYWNLEDQVTKRKIWYSFSDRMIRNDNHYYQTLNYLHFNPVKHDYVPSPYDWEESSVHWYIEHYGREWLRDAWVQYPVKDYGKDWDD
jgi:putative transposase